VHCSTPKKATITSQPSEASRIDIMGWQTHAIALLTLFSWHYRNDQPIPWTIAIYPFLLLLPRLEYLLKACADPRDPPLIPHPYLPFLGHIIGMFRYGAKYYDMVKSVLSLPSHHRSSFLTSFPVKIPSTPSTLYAPHRSYRHRGIPSGRLRHLTHQQVPLLLRRHPHRHRTHGRLRQAHYGHHLDQRKP
jgi:hypothetical protein